MTKEITGYPGESAHQGREVEDPVLEALYPPTPDEQLRVQRLVEIYRRLGRAPTARLDEEGLSSVLRAIDEDRTKDALELLDIILAEPESQLDQGEDLEEALIPEAAAVWRHRRKAAAPRPIIVAGTDLPRIPPRKAARRLAPKRQMTRPDCAGWTVDGGDLAFDLGCPSEIELASRGEVFLHLFSGALSVSTSDGRALAEVDCAPGDGPRLVRIVYAQATADESCVGLQLHSENARMAEGVWFHSAHEWNRGRPEKVGPLAPAMFSVGVYDEITRQEGAAFCRGATILPDDPKYKHYRSVRDDLLVRSSLPGGELVEVADDLDRGRWTIDVPRHFTTVAGMSAAPAIKGGEAEKPRYFEQHAGVEVHIALDGVTWVALSPLETPGADQVADQSEIALGEGPAPGAHAPYALTPLVITEDGDHDIMMLNAEYGHCAWLIPGSGARFVVLTLADPGGIQVSGKKVAPRKPGPVQITRSAGALGQ